MGSLECVRCFVEPSFGWIVRWGDESAFRHRFSCDHGGASAAVFAGSYGLCCVCEVSFTSGISTFGAGSQWMARAGNVVAKIRVSGWRLTAG